jgi:hypothetical protein
MNDVTIHGMQERIEVLERELHAGRIHLRNILTVLEKFLEIKDPLLLRIVAEDSPIGLARSFLDGNKT